MQQFQRDPGDEWEFSMPPLPFQPGQADPGEHTDGEPETEMEPGWRAARSLMRLKSDELLSVMLRPSFRPVRDMELVPIAPCSSCGDGGLRMAGTVRTRTGRATVRACDTCATVEISVAVS